MIGVPGDKSLPLVDAKCTTCPHVGKSRYPETYQCGACYYAMKARGRRKIAKEARDRAVKNDLQAEVYEKKSKEFMARHPGAGKPGPC